MLSVDLQLFVNYEPARWLQNLLPLIPVVRSAARAGGIVFREHFSASEKQYQSAKARRRMRIDRLIDNVQMMRNDVVVTQLTDQIDGLPSHLIHIEENIPSGMTTLRKNSVVHILAIPIEPARRLSMDLDRQFCLDFAKEIL